MPAACPKSTGIDFDIPVILIVGTSMSAGKTMSGRVIVHLLSQMGLNVVGAKLTGAARYRDMLSFGDAGASAIYDFVDAGLPSSACDEADLPRRAGYLLSRIAAQTPTWSWPRPALRRWNPITAPSPRKMIREQVKFKLLCAQDPYAVVGVQQAFQRAPDLVAGGAANTDAGNRAGGKTDRFAGAEPDGSDEPRQSSARPAAQAPCNPITRCGVDPAVSSRRRPARPSESKRSISYISTGE